METLLKEIIEYQEQQIQTVENMKKTGIMPSFMCDDIIKIHTTTIEAVEKQIPKKPAEINERSYDDFYCLDFLCPTCENGVYGQPYKPNNCKHCGQSLDWSEDDGESGS